MPTTRSRLAGRAVLQLRGESGALQQRMHAIYEAGNQEG